MENIEKQIEKKKDFDNKMAELDKKSHSIINEINTCKNIAKGVALFQDYINVEDEIKHMAYEKIYSYRQEETDLIKAISDKALEAFNQVSESKSKKNFKLLMFQISTTIFAIAFVLKCFDVI